MNRRHFTASLLAAAGMSAVSGGSLAQGLEKLNMVVTTSPPDPACHFFFFAKERGFYKEAGIDISITSVSSPANVVRALLAGEADLVWVDGASSLRAWEAGAPLKGLGSFTPRLDFSLVARRSISGIANLTGKRFAIAAVGGSTHLLPRMMMQQQNVDVDSVQWLSLGSNAARAQALLGGSVDATIVATTFVPKLLNDPDLHVIGVVADALPDMLYAWNLTTAKVLEEKRDTLLRFMQATADAVRWAEKNVDEAVQISLNLVPEADKGELRDAISSYLDRQYWSDEGVVSKRQFDFTVEALIKAEQLKAPIPYDQFMDDAVMSKISLQSR